MLRVWLSKIQIAGYKRVLTWDVQTGVESGDWTSYFESVTKIESKSSLRGGSSIFASFALMEFAEQQLPEAARVHTLKAAVSLLDPYCFDSQPLAKQFCNIASHLVAALAHSDPPLAHQLSEKVVSVYQSVVGEDEELETMRANEQFVASLLSVDEP